MFFLNYFVVSAEIVSDVSTVSAESTAAEAVSTNVGVVSKTADSEVVVSCSTAASLDGVPQDAKATASTATMIIFFIICFVGFVFTLYICLTSLCFV